MPVHDQRTDGAFGDVFGARRGHPDGPAPRPPGNEPEDRSAGALVWCPDCRAQFGFMERCPWCEVALVPFAAVASWWSKRREPPDAQ